MSREIKFRAWDKDGCRMMTMGDLFKTDRHWFKSLFYGGREDTALMQYTGLHDKNGKEIYEGDILKIINPTKVGMCWEVTWHDFSWHILLHNFGDTTPYYVRVGNHLINEEVIGNIYENPELLK